MNPVREPGPHRRRQKSARTGSLSSGYRWFESISLQQRVCEPSLPLCGGGCDFV